MNVPAKNPAAIAHRLTIAREDAQTMRTKADYIGMGGGPHPVFQQLAFHEARVALLEWMETAETDAIDDRRQQLETELGTAAALKGGSMLGLPTDVVTKIAHLEILEYGLGVHALQEAS